MEKDNIKPESLMMTYGYNPEWSEGSVKPPIFQTSTFVFKSAEEGKSLFSQAYGLENNLSNGLIYSRLNNPNLEILEERVKLWDGGEAAAVFSSGMAAISTTLLAFLKPGDSIITSMPLYGGSDHFIGDYLKSIGVNVVRFKPTHSITDIRTLITIHDIKNIKIFFIETPANPTNDLIDIEAIASLAKEYDAKLIVDNTYMGPIWQHPLKFGADLVIYSATKYIGGHSDLISGITIGSSEDIKSVKTLRTFFGSMSDPNTCWLMLRSLETLHIRMARQAESAEKVANYLQSNTNISKVYYLGFLKDNQKIIFDKQCLSAGAMISFDVKGGEKEAFRILNKLKLIKLAVSLGSTESLAQHPYTMTHAAIDERTKGILHITPNMIRLSIGVEDAQDIINDLEQAICLVG